MKPTRLLQQLILAGLGPWLVTSALADEPGYFYGGVSAGKARSNIDEGSVAAGALGGAAISGISSDESDNSYKLFGGYQLNRNFGVEAGVYDLGKTSFSSTAPGGAFNNQSSVRGINLDLVGTLPLTERFSLLGRVGAAYGRTRADFSGAGAAGMANPNLSEKKTHAKVGLGVQYEVSRSFWVRGEVERYRVSNGVGGRHNANVYTVGLVFPFGRAPQVVAQAPAPYVAPAPMPAPAPAVVQAPPPPPPPAPVMAPPARVSLTAGSLFGFDRAAVQPSGKAELDTLARSLQGANVQSVTVEGHTDRLGSSEYNQKLSQERADAVKSYLITSGGVSSTSITAVGKGETMPVTQPEDCKGTTATKALVACLQPDRRVDVEVNGTRR